MSEFIEIVETLTYVLMATECWDTILVPAWSLIVGDPSEIQKLPASSYTFNY